MNPDSPPDEGTPRLLRRVDGLGDCSDCGCAVRESGWYTHWVSHHREGITLEDDREE